MLSPVLQGLESAMQHQGDILHQCATLFGTGKLEIAVAGQFPLNEAAQAHTFLESQHPMGKVVIEINVD